MVQGGSGIARHSPALAILYLAVLFLILLYPFEFSMPKPATENTVTWSGDAEGVRFGRSGMLVSAAPPTRLHQRLTTGEGLTIEVWLRSASADQEGPARIVSYSLNPWERNFTLGQAGHDLIMRLRTTGTDANGQPSLDVADVFRPGAMQHIVVTYDFKEERVYVDGKLRVASARPEGTFDTWDPSYFLILGNEFSGGRPWNGTIAYAAVYDRLLPGNTVAARHKSGHRVTGRPAAPGPLLAFDFKDGLESLESGLSAAGMMPPVPRLQMPDRVGKSRLFYSYLRGKLIVAESSAWDLVRNVILFVPFGVFVFALAGRRTRSTASALAVTVVGAVLVSAGFEALQYFVDDRTSSVFDIGTNAAGALMGAIGCWCWSQREKARQ